MAFKDTWVDKVELVDYASAEDINSIALELIRVGELVDEDADNGDVNITVDQSYNGESENPQSGIALQPEFDKKANRATTLSGYGITDAYTQEALNMELGRLYSELLLKADKPVVNTDSGATEYTFEFSNSDNREMRLEATAVESISFNFGDGEYSAAYTSGLSFNSGETPTSINYTDSGILNWVGTDCVNADGLSIFQPSANTHYDIVFYFNGTQFIGLVNGYVPATGNVVSE